MMTNGEQLIQDLHLQNFANPRIARVIGQAWRIYFIFVDSTLPGRMINKQTLRSWMPSLGAYSHFGKTSSVPLRMNLMTPLMDLSDWNGQLQPATFILIDLAGRFESLNKKIFEGLGLKELTLGDLQTSDSTSSLTKGFAKQRTKLNGQETRILKFSECKLLHRYSNGQQHLSAVFSFKTPVTDHYGPKEVPKLAEPDGTLVPNPGKKYTLVLEVEDVDNWLATHPKNQEVTKQDLKDILNAAEVRLWSDAPSFYWQGMAYNLTRFDSAIFPVDIAPKRWNKARLHGDFYLLDKHLSLMMRAIPFLINPMAQMLTRQLKENGYLTGSPMKRT